MDNVMISHVVTTLPPLPPSRHRTSQELAITPIVSLILHARVKTVCVL
jgi:hypothetical protein